MKNQSKRSIQIDRFKAQLTVDLSWGYRPAFLWIKLLIQQLQSWIQRQQKENIQKQG